MTPQEILAILFLLAIYLSALSILVYGVLGALNYRAERRFRDFIEQSLTRGTLDYELLFNSAHVHDIRPIKREFILRRYLEKGAKGIEPFNDKIEVIKALIKHNRYAKKTQDLPYELQGVLHDLYATTADTSELDVLLQCIGDWSKKQTTTRWIHNAWAIFGSAASIGGFVLALRGLGVVG